MAKYKDTEELLKRLNSCKYSAEKITKRQVTYNTAISDACRIIDATPDADVVEVVRCGECKYLMQDGRCYEFADDNIKPSVSDYCSYGEKKDD